MERNQYNILFNKVNPDMEFVAKIINKAVEVKVCHSLDKAMLGGIPNLEITIANGDYSFKLIPVGETEMCTFYVTNVTSGFCRKKDTKIDIIMELIELLGKHKVRGKLRMKYARKLDSLLKIWDNGSRESSSSERDSRLQDEYNYRVR